MREDIDLTFYPCFYAPDLNKTFYPLLWEEEVPFELELIDLLLTYIINIKFWQQGKARRGKRGFKVVTSTS